MQKILLVFTLIFLLGQTRAACTLPATVAAGTGHPRPHLRFKEGKGTMGFVYGIVLGPIGYFGVRVFSRHNEMKRHQAARGFKTWGMILATGGIFMVCGALKDNGQWASQLIAALWSTP